MLQILASEQDNYSLPQYEHGRKIVQTPNKTIPHKCPTNALCLFSFFSSSQVDVHCAFAVFNRREAQESSSPAWTPFQTINRSRYRRHHLSQVYVDEERSRYARKHSLNEVKNKTWAAQQPL